MRYYVAVTIEVQAADAEAAIRATREALKPIDPSRAKINDVVRGEAWPAGA